MTNGPVLLEGEEIIHHHVPHLGAFKRTALLLLAISLVPTLVIATLIPDTFWAAVPVFLTCLLLMQERYNLGKHAAWVTNQRVILQGDDAIALADIETLDTFGNAVRLRRAKGQRIRLNYAKDRQQLLGAIQTAKAESAP